jgi:NADH-quinone oxidoreductase subunit E
MLQVERSRQEKSESGFSNFKVELWKYQGELGALIPLLQSAQDAYGYIPESAIDYISQIVGTPAAEIYGVITFYSQFRLKPMGKNIIKVCDGTACHVNSSTGIIKTVESELGVIGDETTEDGLFTVQKVACLGCCSLSPVVMINDETFGLLTPKKVRQLLKEYREREPQA